VQDDLDDLHGVVPHFLDFSFSRLAWFPALVLLLLDEGVGELEFVLFEVIVQIAQHCIALLNELVVDIDVLHIPQHVQQFGHAFFAEGVLVDQGFGVVDEFEGVFLYLLFEDVYFFPEFFDEF
jgi:hypothetical protein